MMESRNPAFRRVGFGQQQAPGRAPSAGQLQDMYNAPSYVPPAQARPMTVDDVVVRGFLCLAMLVITAALAWVLVPVELAAPVLIVAVIAQLGIWAFITFGQRANAPLALAFAAMLAVHSLKIIRVTPRFAKFVIGAGFALVGLMLVNVLVSWLGPDSGIGIRDPSNPLAYIFSVVAILIGCFFLLLDFNAVEEGVRQGAPEKFAWYC